MKLMVTVMLFLATFLPFAHADSSNGWHIQQLRAVNFMVGRWEGHLGRARVTTSYRPDQTNSALIGYSKMTDADGQDRFFEKSVIIVAHGSLMLKPYPMGQKGVPFVGTAVSRTHLVFENPENDYPARITFWLDENRVLWTRVEGTQNGEPKVLQYSQNKIDTQLEQ